MSESRVFMLNGVELPAVVNRLENFFRGEKGMEVQCSQTTDGYVMQASQPKDGWKTLTGMRLAVTVQLAVTGGQMNVTVGEGQWSDKIGAGAIGLFVAWPLAITAGMGAFKQKKLPAEIFQVIENCILSSGRTVVMHGAGPTVAAGMSVCPQCKGQVRALNSAICAERSSIINAPGAALRFRRKALFARNADKSCKKGACDYEEQRVQNKTADRPADALYGALFGADDGVCS